MKRVAPILVAALCAIAALGQNTTLAPPPPPATNPPVIDVCCANHTQNSIWNLNAIGAVVMNNGEGYLNSSQILTMSVWVRLLTEEQLSLSYIIGKKALFSWDTVKSYYGLYWDHAVSRLVVELKTSTGAVLQTSAQSSIPAQVWVPNGQWRLITLQLDSINGRIRTWVDTVPDLFIDFPALKGTGVNTSDPLMFGCQDYFTNCATGKMADIFLINRALTTDELQQLFMHRQCPLRNYNPQPNANLSCAAPIEGIMHYTRSDTSSFSEQGPAGTTPGAYLVSANSAPPFNAYRAYHTLAIQRTAPVPANLDCGPSQTLTVQLPYNGTLPNGPDSWIVHFVMGWPTSPAGDSFSVYANSATSANLFYTSPYNPDMTYRYPIVVPLALVGAGGAVTFVVVPTTQTTATCVTFMDAFAAGPDAVELSNTGGANLAYDSELISAVVLNLPDTASNLAIVNSTDPCTSPNGQKGMIQWPAPGIDIPILVNFAGLPPGAYQLCVYPGPLGALSASAHALRTQTDFTNGQVLVAALPVGGAPLRAGWVTNLLHLGSQFTSVIPNGRLDTDYFAFVGGQASIQPKVGDAFNDGANGNLTWTPLSSALGLWNYGPAVPELSVQYAALAVYSNSTQTLVLGVRHWYAAVIWMDGNQVFKSTIADQGTMDVSAAISLTPGWHQFIFKYTKYTGNTSYFQIRFDKAQGLAWAFELPGARGHPNVPYNDTCAAADQGEVQQCIPGANVAKGECFNIGCCWVESMNQCLTPPGSRLSYRLDARCGAGFPAPAATIGQCDKDNFVGATCCSPYGWCGNSTQWCTCPTCVNYNYMNDARCRYKNICPNNGMCKCGSTTPIFKANVSTVAKCEEMCDFDSGCKGYSLDSRTLSCYFFYSDCAFTVNDPNNTMVTKRKYCNCSFRNDCPSSNCQCTSLSVAQEMVGTTYTASECMAACQFNYNCTGYNYLNGTCYLMEKTCPEVKIAPAGTSVYQVWTCPGLDDPIPAQPSNANIVNTAVSRPLGCFSDTAGYLLLEGGITATMPNLYLAPGMTLQMCEGYCLGVGALFFGMYNGTRCMCGLRQHKDNLVAAIAAECKVPCAGNATQACGGFRATLVYVIQPSSLGCANSSYRFGDFCYSMTPEMNFSSAAAVCANRGGVVATAMDIPTAQFALSLPYALNTTDTFYTYRQWVGAVADNSKTRFEWIDGAPWTLSSWRQGEPNALASESCVEGLSNYGSPWVWKGTWNNVGCQSSFPAVCKVPVPPAMLPNPSAGLASSSGGYSCSANGPSYLYDMTLQLRLPLTANIQDVIAGGPATSFVVNGTVSTPPSGNFLTLAQAGGPPGAIMFSSSTNAYINVTAAPQLNPPLETLSICLWIMPTAAADSTVLAKAMNNNLNSSWTNYQYALKWVGGRLCAYVGYHYVCTVQKISVGNGYHLCLVSSVSQISLFINGILETRSSRSGISEYDSSVTPLIIGAEQSGGNGAVSRYFTGAISDVRFYSSELAAAYIISLFMCTQYAPPQQSLSVYQGAEVNVTLYGHGMYPLTGVRLITSGTCANPPVNGGGAVRANVYAAGTETMIVDVPGSIITSGTSNTTVCFPLLTALASTDFPVDSGIRLQPVAITNFRPSGGTTISIANNGFPANVSVTGYNLRPQHYLTLAMDPKCEMIMIPPQSLQFTVSADGTSASFMISEAPMNGAPTNLFVCWQPAGSDRGKAVVKAYNTGLILSIQAGPENLQIAVSTGIYHYGPNEYTNGAYFGAANNVTSCARASYFQNATVVTVTMGVYSDYYILQSGTTLCSFLLGNQTAKYSPMDPAAPWWNGLSFPLYFGDWNRLGGSPAGYPADGRTYLAAWGSLTPDDLGGYGSSEVGQNPSWNRAFTITARSIPKNNVYFNVLYPPYIIYPGYPFQVLVQLTDVYGNIHMGMNTPTFKLSCSIGGVTTITTFGGYDFNRGPVNIPVGSTFVCNVSTTQVTANSNFVSFIVNMMALPTGDSSMSYLSPGGVVQTVLKLGTPTQGLVPLSDGNPPMQQDLLAAAGGEAAQQPRSGQSVQSNDLSGASYTWLAENNVQGNFGAGAPNNTIQYFAFAMYSPGDQGVIIDFQANPVGVVYLDGVLRSYTSGGNNAMSPPIAITSGWHQVIVKLVSNNQTTMTIAIAGYGLMTAMAMPNQMPVDASIVNVGVNFNGFLHLGMRFTDALSTSFSDDSQVPTTSQPVAGNTAGGLQWSALLTNTAINGVQYAWLYPQLGFVPSVGYLAIAVYATTSFTYSFTALVSGPTAIYLDGLPFVTMPTLRGNQSATTSFAPYLSAGWHQLLIKLGASALPNAVFALQCNTQGLGWAYQIPPNIPLGSMAVPAGAIKQLLQLQGPMSSVPGKTFRGLPYKPTSDLSRAPATDFTLTGLQPTVGASQAITLGANGASISGFSWQPKLSYGVFGMGDDGFGGAISMYWATSLYSSTSQSVTPKAQHSDSLTLYLDGNQASRLPGTSMLSYQAGPTFAITPGWHTLIVRVEVPTAFTLYPVANAQTGIVWSNATQVCTQNHQEVCTLQAFCPYGAIRPDGAATPSASSGIMYAPVAGTKESWVQISNGAGQCGVTRTPPSNVAQRQFVGCCDLKLRPLVSLQLQGTGLAMAYQVPPTPLPVPTISVIDSDSSSPTVVISAGGDPNVVIVYTTDGSDPTTKGTRYSLPLAISRSTTITAATATPDMTRFSALSSVYVNPASPIQPLRTTLVSGATTPLILQHASAGDIVALIQTTDSRRGRVLNSVGSAQQVSADGAYSGTLTLKAMSTNGGPVSALIPANLQVGSYVMIHFNAQAISQGTSGSVVAASFSVGTLSITPALVVPNVTVNFTVTGGAVAGDAIIFMPSVTQLNCPSTCAGYASAPTLGFVDGASTFAASVIGGTTVNCACYLPYATAPVGYNGPWAYVSLSISAPVATESVLGWTGGVGLATGNQLTFIGSFSATAAYTEYSVSVAPSVTGRALTLPLVTPVSKTGGAAITCTVTVAAGTSGRWQATISHNGNVLPSATLPALIFIPPAPTVTGVTGACATDSSQCLSGTSVLTIAGTNFDSVQSSDMTVALSAQGGAPSASCNILQVMPTQLTCQLQLAQGTTPATPWTGSYLVAVSVAADPSVNALSTGAIGTLSVGGRTGSPGFSPSTATSPPGPSSTPGSTPTPSRTGGAAADADGDKKDDTTLIIIVAVLAVLLVGALVGLIVARMRSNSIRRNNEQFTPGAGGDDYLPMSEKGQIN
jgi:hypothetical protein